ncbi:MAG: metallophosphoesterase [Gammaproteobacteria bacterium]
MKIQYFSDIHLEFGAAPPVAGEADVIIAAGDIDVGAAGVGWLQQSGLPTIYVCGNHEYYGGEIGAVQDTIRDAAAGTNVHFLECATAVIGGARFLGATLWTDFAGADATLMQALAARMNDYVQVRCGLRLLTPQDVLGFHRRSRAWLAAELAREHPGPTVVVTHHAPLPASWHEAPDAPLRAAYCSDLATLVDGHRIDAWIHGHVHATRDYRHGATRIACNPRGYSGIQEVADFDPARTIEL